MAYSRHSFESKVKCWECEFPGDVSWFYDIQPEMGMGLLSRYGKNNIEGESRINMNMEIQSWLQIWKSMKIKPSSQGNPVDELCVLCVIHGVHVSGTTNDDDDVGKLAADK